MRCLRVLDVFIPTTFLIRDANRGNSFLPAETFGIPIAALRLLLDRSCKLSPITSITFDYSRGHNMGSSFCPTPLPTKKQAQRTTDRHHRCFVNATVRCRRVIDVFRPATFYTRNANRGNSILSAETSVFQIAALQWLLDRSCKLSPITFDYSPGRTRASLFALPPSQLRSKRVEPHRLQQ